MKPNILSPTEKDNGETKDSNSLLPPALLLLLSIQHVIILFGGIIIVPVMLIKIYHFPPAEGFRVLFITTLFAALGTVLQVIRIKKFGLGRPMFMGTSGPFLACAHMAIGLGGPALLSNLVFMSAPFQFLFSYCLRFLRHILTPTVGGVVIMLAVTGLLKDSIITWCENPGITGQAAFIDIAIGAATVTGMVFSEWLLGKQFRQWSLALGILLGSFLALVLGQVDLSPMESMNYFGIPDKLWVGFVFKFDLQHWMLYFTFIIAVFVSSIKYSGDVMALQKIEDPQTRKMDYDGLQGGLYASAFTATLSGLAGGLPSTSHAPNIPVMEMTGVISKRVAVTCSLILTVLAFSPKASMALLCIPAPVIGAVGIVLVGHLFSTGMRLVAYGDLNFKNAFIAGLSICSGLVMESDLFFPQAFPAYLTPFTTNGFAVGGMVAVFLTILGRLKEDSGVAINLLPKLRYLGDLHQKVEEACRIYALGKNPGARLVLACEEMFVHMVDEFSNKSFKGRILFRIKDRGDRINVEIQGGNRIKTVDDPDYQEMKNLEDVDKTYLKNIGLTLFSKLAKDITHYHIANYTYIQFSIMKE